MTYINKPRFFALMLSLTLLFSLLMSYAKSTGSNIADSVVRLHVIANSNSESDQGLKLKVRDRILRDASHIFENSDSAADALHVARVNSSLIKEIAEDEIHSLGFDYPVKVSVGKYPFPTKVYGDIALPTGKYNAVRIEIGEASGENWWCVMYPPLCFTDGVVTATDDAKKQLENSLSPSDYALITQTDSVPVEIRFRIVEIFCNLF